jgi:hypothetical protein
VLARRGWQIGLRRLCCGRSETSSDNLKLERGWSLALAQLNTSLFFGLDPIAWPQTPLYDLNSNPAF